MLRHLLEGSVIIISQQTHINPVLVEMPILLSQQRREAIVRAFDQSGPSMRL